MEKKLLFKEWEINYPEKIKYIYESLRGYSSDLVSYKTLNGKKYVVFFSSSDIDMIKIDSEENKYIQVSSEHEYFISKKSYDKQLKIWFKQKPKPEVLNNKEDTFEKRKHSKILALSLDPLDGDGYYQFEIMNSLLNLFNLHLVNLVKENKIEYTKIEEKGSAFSWETYLNKYIVD